MKKSSSISTQHLQLHKPIIIDGVWQYEWYDPALQLSLLLNDNYFYVINNNDDPIQQIPKLFYRYDSLPPKILLAKLSLDKKLIVIQASLTSLLVLDTVTKKKWLIDIKKSNDHNYIVFNGIIWSNHSGNSQDLIIITNKGIEIYKISSIRNQCKLSRIITQTITNFWYEHNHRVILCGTKQKLEKSIENKLRDISIRGNNYHINASGHSQSSGANNGNSMNNHPGIQGNNSNSHGNSNNDDIKLLMDAYFIRFDRPAMASIELPPPDKSPRFELKLNITPDNIFLVSLYGMLYCVVHCHDNGEDFLIGYSVTKTSIDTKFYLLLTKVSPSISISTFDNLLVCHCHTIEESIVFDILHEPRTIFTGVITQEVIDPICSFSSLYFMDKVINSDSNSSNNNNNDENDSEDVTHDSHADSNNSSGIVAYNNKNFIIYNYDELDFIDVMNEYNMKSIANTDENKVETRKLKYKKLSAPIKAETIYNYNDYEFIYPNIIAEKTKRIKWNIYVDISKLLLTFYDPRETITFLSRRGLHYCHYPLYNGGVLMSNYTSNYGKIAKQYLLCQLIMSLYKRVGLSWLEEICYSLSKSYANESNRLSKLQQEFEEFDGLDTSSSFTASLSASQSGKYSSTQRRTGSLANGFMDLARRASFGSQNSPNGNPANNSVSNSSGKYIPTGCINGVEGKGQSYELYNELAKDPMFKLDYEPLEFVNPFVLLLPYIKEVGRVIRNSSKGINKHASSEQKSQAEILRNASSQNDNDGATNEEFHQAKASCVAITTRRDSTGNLVVTQTELLCYVWVPMLLYSNIDVEYMSWALTTYISVLREKDITVTSAVSVLLMTVLFNSGKTIEVARLLQNNFFPDHVDTALSALEMYSALHTAINNEDAPSSKVDITEDTTDNKDSPRNSNSNAFTVINSKNSKVESDFRRTGSKKNLKKDDNVDLRQPKVDMEFRVSSIFLLKEDLVNKLRHRDACNLLLQAGLDMLWRLNELVLLVRWYLSHGRVREAIALCSKRNGRWNPKLSPGSITGLEVFNAAVISLSMIKLSVEDERILLESSKIKNFDHASSETAKLEELAAAVADAIAKIDAAVKSPSRSNAKMTPSQKYEVIKAKERQEVVMQQRAELMHTVFMFIKEWDPAVLLTAKVLYDICSDTLSIF